MYGFNVQVSGNFDKAVARVTEALKTEGFDARRPWRAPLRGALKRVQFCSRQNCGVLTDIGKLAGEMRVRLERVRGKLSG